MIQELFTQDLSLWTCLWQSTVFAACGMAAGWLLRRRPARAYQVLLFAMIAAAAVPFLSAVVKHFDLGAFVAAETELPRGWPEMPADTAAPSPVPALTDAVPAESHPMGTVEPVSWSIPWRTVILYAWLVATLLLSTRLVVTFLYGVHLVQRASRPPCEHIRQAADRAKSRLGLGGGIEVRASGRIRSPVVWCWSRRPILLLPNRGQDMKMDWSGVVAHELAHYRRRDHITGLLAEVTASLLPWNPLLWVSKRYLVRLGEQACDDWVVAAGEPCEDYAESLLRFRPQRQMAFLPAVVHSKKGLAARVRRILTDACSDPRTGTKWALAVSSLAICVGLAVAFAQARPAPTAAPAEPANMSAKSLHQAAAAGDLAEVKRLIAEGADLAASAGEKTLTPLGEAAHKGHAEIVKVLLEKGADVENAADYFTPLYYAIWSGDQATVKALIDGGANVNVLPAENDFPPLIYAIWEMNAGIVTILLDAGADLNVKTGGPLSVTNTSGFTPLYWAAVSGNRETFDLLLARGDYAETIHMAACKGKLEQVKTLVEEDAGVGTKDESGCTPLHWAVFGDSLTVAEYLIAKGADVNVKDHLGFSPLHRARSLSMVKLLVANGADRRAAFQQTGQMKLQMACVEGDKDIVDFLLSEGEDVNLKDKNGNTLLALAASGGHAGVVELLITRGADLNATDNRGGAAIDIAMKREHTDVVNILRKHGAKEESSVASEDARAVGDNDPPAARVEPAPTQSLHEAAAAGNMEQVNKLLAQGADVDEKDKDNSTPLHEAAGNGWRDVARLLLEKGANVEAADASGQTPLHRAARFGSRHICALLFAKGAGVNARDSLGNTPLHAALDRQEVDRSLFELLLAKGADVKAMNEQGETPLHLACRVRKVATYTQQRGEAADVLLAHGAEVDATDKSGRTPLHVAVENGQDKVAGLLLANGATVEAKNAAGATALNLAARNRYWDIVELLVNRGADVNSVDSEGRTPLHYAARAGDNETVERLIAQGADVNAKDAHGETPAFSAAMWNRKGRDTVTLLLSKGASISSIQLAAYLGDLAQVKGFLESGVGDNTEDAYAPTALHAAAIGDQKEVAEFLLSQGAAVNAEPAIFGGATPLHCAASVGSRDVAELLIRKGAEIEAKLKNGSTPLHFAAHAGEVDTARLLIAHGADVNAKLQGDWDGWTPLHAAARYGHKDLVLLLLDHGADIDDGSLEAAGSAEHLDVVRLLIDKGARVSSPDGLLYPAVWRGDKQLTEALIKKGANVNAQLRAWGGYSVSLYALWDDRPHASVLELLLAHGANPNANDEDWYLLHYAAKDAEVTRVLLDKGANPNVIDKTHGQSPLHVSATKGCKPAVELLVAHGADPNLKDYDGRTPLALAREKGHNEIVEFLRQHGARE